MTERITIMGQVLYRNRCDRFGMFANDRLRHVLILGQTGTGKSTLLSTMAKSDIDNGAGVMLIDPHGDLAEKLFQSIPKRRKNDVLYIDPSSLFHSVPINPLAENISGDKSLITSAIISAFQKTWPDFWGPRSEQLLRMTLLAILEFPGMSLMDANRFINDSHWRNRLSPKIKDEVVRKYWIEEFPQLPERLTAETISPLQNKLGALVGNPILRRVLGQAKTRLNLADALSRNRIILVNLSRGKLGYDACTLLGSMLLSLFESAVLARAHIAESERKPFYLYIDEFSMFASPGFVVLLSEGRKYGLGVTLAQQSLASMPQSLQADILTNSGTLACFRVGALDAFLLKDHLGPNYTPQDLMTQPAHVFALRMLINGKPAEVFSARTIL